MALVGLAIYVASRTSRAPLWSPALARIALWLWNATVFGGVVTLSAGWSRGPQEYREWVLPLAALLGLGVVLNGYNIYRTVGTRQLPEVYIFCESDGAAVHRPPRQHSNESDMALDGRDIALSAVACDEICFGRVATVIRPAASYQ